MGTNNDTIAGSYKYVNPYMEVEKPNEQDNIVVNRRNLIDSLNDDSVYIHPTKFSISSHRKRPLYKVIHEDEKHKKKSVIRKIRGKNVCNGDEIIFDTITANELGIEKRAGEVYLKRILGIEKYTTFLWKHPKEDIRIAYKLFLLGMLVGVVSVVISIIGL